MKAAVALVILIITAAAFVESFGKYSEREPKQNKSNIRKWMSKRRDVWYNIHESKVSMMKEVRRMFISERKRKGNDQ